MIRDNRFFSRGSRACQHTSPHCVDQHLVVRQLRGVSQTSSTQLDTARTYPQVRQLNDTSNLLELPFGTPPGKVQLPSQSPEMATNNHQLMPIFLRCTKPSRWWWQPPRVTSESGSETRTPSSSRCNHSSNTLGFSSNLIKMMNQ